MRARWLMLLSPGTRTSPSRRKIGARLMGGLIGERPERTSGRSPDRAHYAEPADETLRGRAGVIAAARDGIEQRRTDHHRLAVPGQPLDVLGAGDAEAEGSRQSGHRAHALQQVQGGGAHPVASAGGAGPADAE